MADVKEMTSKALERAGSATPAKKASEVMSKPAGLAVAGAALAAMPLVAEQVAKRLGPKGSELADRAKDAAKGQVAEKAKQAAPDVAKSLPGGGLLSKVLPGGGDKGNDEGSGDGTAAPGHGSGRRMPIQQSVDVGVPLKTAFNHWTQYEEWPEFMHRVESAEKTDDTTIAFQTKVWGINRRFEANILEQRPDERIEWDVEEGLAHTGVVTFHKLSDRLTRIEITLDIEPHGLVEKAGRGWRFAKRAVRGDLHRFKAHVELNEDEPAKGWRGTITDGEVKRRTDRKTSRSSRSRGSRNGGSPNGSSRSSSKNRSRSRSS
jgi:uncharacterized membrane protein